MSDPMEQLDTTIDGRLRRLAYSRIMAITHLAVTATYIIGYIILMMDYVYHATSHHRHPSGNVTFPPLLTDTSTVTLWQASEVSASGTSPDTAAAILQLSFRTLLLTFLLIAFALTIRYCLRRTAMTQSCCLLYFSMGAFGAILEAASLAKGIIAHAGEKTEVVVHIVVGHVLCLLASLSTPVLGCVFSLECHRRPTAFHNIRSVFRRRALQTTARNYGAVRRSVQVSRPNDDVQDAASVHTSRL